LEIDEPTLSTTSILFELCRIASELQMAHLEQISIQQYCEICHLYFLSVDPSTTIATATTAATDGDDEDLLQTSRTNYLQSVLRMCEKNLLERLHVNVMFLLEYGHPLHVNEEKISLTARSTVATGGGKSGRGEGTGGSGGAGGVPEYDSPTGLRKAISESVHDVTSLLTHDPDTDLVIDMDMESEPYHLIPSEERGVGKRIENSSGKRSSSSSTQRSTISKSNPTKRPPPSSSSLKKKSGGGGGIYKLLLEETSSSSGHLGGGGYGRAMGTEIDASLLLETSSSHSHEGEVGDDPPMEYHDDYYYDYSHDPVATGPILIDDQPNKPKSSSGAKLSMDRKGKTLNVEEFIRSQHSLAPLAQKKLTPAQKRSCDYPPALLPLLIPALGWKKFPNQSKPKRQ
jgi:hypothetical protein